MAMSSAIWITLLATVVSFWACTPSFGVPASRQEPLSVLRERTGLSISQKITDPAFPLSPKEARLASRLAELGKKGDWQGARRLYGSYKGTGVPVINAAILAAYRCGQCQEAAGIYNKLRNLCVGVDKVSLLAGMKIFGKLQDPAMVDTIWAEVTERGWVDQFTCGARIDAAAYMGDVEGAAHVLDVMQKGKIEVYVHQFTSAILACAKAKRPSHNTALYLFNTMLDHGISPTIVTFANLAQAHVKASLEQIQRVRATMKEHDVLGNSVFAESYLGALTQRRLITARDAQAITAELEDLPEREGRLKEAQSALLEIQASNVRLSTLCRRVLTFLEQEGL